MFQRMVMAATAMVALFAGLSAGQERPIAPPPPPPPEDDRPQLIVNEAGGRKRPLSLAKADVRVVIVGNLAETTMTLTFRNDADRVMEGELVFPLPEGATVSGYGLDVGGVIVDGVPVEKTKARVVFETEVRKGVDPGLVEHVRGNAFRTRVYPIPARGVRTVKVQHVAELAETPDGPACVLPMNWGDEPVREYALRIELVRPAVEPALRGGPAAGLELRRQGNRVLVEKTYEDARFADDLAIVLPKAPPASAVVEKRLTRGGLVEHPFVITDVQQAPSPLDRPVNAVSKVALLWDASLSRAESDRAREKELLAALFARWVNAKVDLIVFRDVPEAPVTFEVAGGKAQALLDHLDKLPYDGATDLGALAVPAGQYDLALLFTDGLGTIGKDVPAAIKAPLYIVSDDARSDHALLAHLARAGGGAYFNLRRSAPEQAVASVGGATYALIAVEGVGIGDVVPSMATPVHGRVTVSGKLIAPEATVTLKYGYGDDVVKTSTFTIRQADASETGLAARQWAQQKAAELAAREEANREALLALGREYNIVTPNTSLMVLETLQQHLAYDIAPPDSRPEMLKEFLARREQTKRTAEKTAAEKTQQVVTAWEERVKWWEREFKVAPDFKYVAPDERQRVGVAGVRGPAGAGGPAPAKRPSVASGATGDGTTDVLVGPGSAGGTRGTSGRDVAGDRFSAGEAPASPRTPARAGGEDRERRAEAVMSPEPAAVAATPALARARADGLHQAASGAARPAGTSIVIKAWDPKTPYLDQLKSTYPEHRYAIYLMLRRTHGRSPAFFLDCADFFLRNGERALGLRVLSNVAELRLDAPELLRVAAHRYHQLGELDLAADLFERVLKLRPEEPQSHRDLALVLADRAERVPMDELSTSERAKADYRRALSLLNDVVTKPWDRRFEQIELTAVLEANRIAARAAAAGVENPLDSRLRKLLDLDVRIVLTWDADATDIDLHVLEPSGEMAFYSHNRTTIGGLVSRDFTQGYGPEEYLLRRAMPGKYTIKANFYGSSQQKVTGATTIQATVITAYGRPDEKRQTLTLRLAARKEMAEVGSIEVGR